MACGGDWSDERRRMAWRRNRKNTDQWTPSEREREREVSLEMITISRKMMGSEDHWTRNKMEGAYLYRNYGQIRLKGVYVEWSSLSVFSMRDTICNPRERERSTINTLSGISTGREGTRTSISSRRSPVWFFSHDQSIRLPFRSTADSSLRQRNLTSRSAGIHFHAH